MKIKLDKTLMSNTFFLYILTFSSQFFSLITVPYLTRVLGPETYGKQGVALAFMTYVSLILDLGFMLSATQKVVEHKEEKRYVGELLTAVLLIKLFLSGIVAVVFGAFVQCNSSMKMDMSFYMTYFVAYVLNSLFPNFYYRGIEKMRVITYCTLIIKVVFTVMVFFTVKSEVDLIMIPVSTLIGNVIVLLVAYYDVVVNYKIKLAIPNRRIITNVIKETIPFFVSRIASTVYQALNTIILNGLYGTSAMVGYYTSADKVVSISKTCSSPIADSLYPYMIRKKDYSLIKKLMMITMPVIVIAGIILFINADVFCIWLFGDEYQMVGNILRCLLPIMVVILPTYIICFPVMIPMGLSKYANMSNVIGMVIQVIGLMLLFATNHIDVYSLCILTSISEVSVFLFRASVVAIHVARKRIPK